MNVKSLIDIADYAVFTILIIMSIISLAYFIERLRYYKLLKISKYSSKKELEIKTTENLNTIATIGSNAPYIGLLGTVLGIILTFYQIGEAGGLIDTKTIMIGLSLSLRATATGLLVAIPSIIFYNILNRKVEVILGKWDILNEKI